MSQNPNTYQQGTTGAAGHMQPRDEVAHVGGGLSPDHAQSTTHTGEQHKSGGLLSKIMPGHKDHSSSSTTHQSGQGILPGQTSATHQSAQGILPGQHSTTGAHIPGAGLLPGQHATTQNPNTYQQGTTGAVGHMQPRDEVAHVGGGLSPDHVQSTTHTGEQHKSGGLLSKIMPGHKDHSSSSTTHQSGQGILPGQTSTTGAHIPGAGLLPGQHSGTHQTAGTGLTGTHTGTGLTGTHGAPHTEIIGEVIHRVSEPRPVVVDTLPFDNEAHNLARGNVHIHGAPQGTTTGTGLHGTHATGSNIGTGLPTGTGVAGSHATHTTGVVPTSGITGTHLPGTTHTTQGHAIKAEAGVGPHSNVIDPTHASHTGSDHASQHSNSSGGGLLSKVKNLLGGHSDSASSTHDATQSSTHGTTGVATGTGIAGTHGTHTGTGIVPVVGSTGTHQTGVVGSHGTTGERGITGAVESGLRHEEGRGFAKEGENLAQTSAQGAKRY